MTRVALGCSLGVAVLLVVLAAGAAPAQQDVTGYDGSNPFRCVLQQAGQGTDIPDPGADPLCVEYDKTRQDVSDTTIAAFLAGEPQRFAMAGDKCFYFQHDHWRSRVVAGQPATETYRFDGSYFLDRAAGRGGAYAENFSINGQPAPDLTPLLPERYRPFFSEGRGGLISDMGIAVEPRCVAMACANQVYRGAPPPQVSARCAAAARDEATAGAPENGSTGGTRSGQPSGNVGEDADADDDRRAAGTRAGDVRFSEARRSPRFTG